MPNVIAATNTKKFLDADGLTYFARKLNNYPTNEVIAAVIEGVQDALDEKVDISSVGAANGVAELDSSGKVPSSQLPSYVDDVLEFSSYSAFPETGESGKIYVDTSTNFSYRWSGSTYIRVDDPGIMTGATASADGSPGLVPTPHTTDVDYFLSGDGSWKPGGKPMVILSYGHSTWAEFIEAYTNHVIVYCRASSNSNPATGTQGRMAFMAYTNNGDNPTEVEFQYYRSVSSHNINQQTDQVYVYKLTNKGAWSVIVRNAGTPIAAGNNISIAYSSNSIVVSGNYQSFTGATSSTDGATGLVPAPSASDANKFLNGTGNWENADSVLSYSSSSGFPQTGENNIIYIDNSTNYLYRWTGSEYTQVGGTSIESITDAQIDALFA